MSVASAIRLFAEPRARSFSPPPLSVASVLHVYYHDHLPPYFDGQIGVLDAKILIYRVWLLMPGQQQKWSLIRYVVVSLGVAALLAALWPITSPATPIWKVWVVDESGNPVQGALVRLSWKNYSAESEGHEEDLRTDENGYVVFSARTMKASVLRRMFETLASATGGVHAGYGPHAYVLAFGSAGLAGEAENGKYMTDWTGAPSEMESRIVLRPRG